MKNNTTRIVLIAGASSGIGKACAVHLYRQGYRVYGTSRKAETPFNESFQEKSGAPLLKMIPMDVNSEASVKQAVDFIVTCEGRVDVAVNCAGYGLAGAVEDTSVEEARAQMETNFFGVLRICRTVLPIMRRQQGGYIVNISSIGGVIGIPFQSVYSASKFAVEGFTEALRAEVQRYGIRVVLVEPGDFHTGFTAHRLEALRAKEHSLYEEQFTKALGVMEADEMKGHSPEKIGHLLEKIITTKAPRVRYRVGPVSERVAVELKKIIPSKLFERAIMWYYHVS